MDITPYKAQIAQLTPIGTLNEQNLETLQESMEILHLSKGEKLFIEGQEDKSYYFLLAGSISIRSRLSVPNTIQAGSPEALKPLSHFQPRKHSATTKSDCSCLKIDSQSLEMILSWEQSGNYEVNEIDEKSDIQPLDWMGRVLKNPVFQGLPPSRLQQLFKRLEVQRYQQGEVIFTQEDVGESFFILASGRASVMRATPRTPQGTPVAQLVPGDTFGEDALLSKEPRNASIQVLENANIMSLPKEDFLELVQKPALDSIDYMEAADLVSRNQAKWIDVRSPSEFGANHLDNSINLPLLFMRLKVSQLDPSFHYIVYCNDGNKSQAGAYLMKKFGFHARTLEGGLSSSQT